VSIAPAFLTQGVPSEDESRLIEYMTNALTVYSAANREAEEYYEGTHVARQFGISIPPSMQNLRRLGHGPP
jgi:hypothetical protein